MATKVKLPIRDHLRSYGAFVVTPTAECFEVLCLSKGGCSLNFGWVDYHTAMDCVRQGDVAIFIDPGNAIYTKFMQQVWPHSAIWSHY